MRTSRLFIAFAAIACAASCDKLGTPEKVYQSGTVEFTAVNANADPNKTTISPEGKVTWNENDEIGIYDGTNYVKATIVSIDGATAKFTADVDTEAASYTAVYPYAATASDGSGFSGGKVQLSPVFKMQTQQQANVGVAYTTGKTFEFKNATSLLSFTTQRTDIVKVRLHAIGGEYISDNLSVDPQTGSVAPEGSTAKSSDITFNVDGNAGTYAIGVVPGVTLSKGFTLLLFKDNAMEQFIGQVAYGKSLSIATNDMIAMGDIDSRIKPLVSYIWWKDPDGNVANNIGQDRDVFAVNAFSKACGVSVNYSVAESDIPVGATVTYAITQTLNATKGYGLSKLGDIVPNTGVVKVYTVTNKPTLCAAANITVTVTAYGVTQSVNFPFFIQQVNDTFADINIHYTPFVLLSNGKKENCLPAPVVTDKSGAQLEVCSMTIRDNVYYTNFDGPAEHVCSARLDQIPNTNDEYIQRVSKLYYAKVGKTGYSGMPWPYTTFYHTDKPTGVSTEAHQAASPLYVGTDNKVYVKAESDSEHYWQDNYGYPNGVLVCGVRPGNQAGADMYNGSVQYLIPFVVYFNSELEY